MYSEICDVIVVGAGPGGSVAARTCAQQGLITVLLDAQPEGRDKICGDAIGPEGAAALKHIGMGDILSPASHIESFTLTANSYRGELPSIIPAGRDGYGLPRQYLDRSLLRKAAEAGATFEQQRVTGVQNDARGITVTTKSGKTFIGHRLIAADGSSGTIRRLLNVPEQSDRDLSIAIRAYIPDPGSATDLVIVWDTSDEAKCRGYAWAFRLPDATLNVGYGTVIAASRNHGGRSFLIDRAYELLAPYLPEIAETPPANFRGARLRTSATHPILARDSVLFVGDAAGLINPISGEGIHHAILSGFLAGRSMQYSDPAGTYSKLMHHALGRHHQAMRLIPKFTTRRIVHAGIALSAQNQGFFGNLADVTLSSGTPKMRYLPAMLANLARNTRNS